MNVWNCVLQNKKHMTRFEKAFNQVCSLLFMIYVILHNTIHSTCCLLIYLSIFLPTFKLSIYHWTIDKWCFFFNFTQESCVLVIWRNKPFEYIVENGESDQYLHFFSSTGRRPVSYCHGVVSVVRASVRSSVRASVNFFFKKLLLRNYWLDFNQISQECSLGGPLSNSFK